MFGWECTPAWYRIARGIEDFILDPFSDLFITVCIIVNTVFMALDHAGISDNMANILNIGNYVRFLPNNIIDINIK